MRWRVFLVIGVVLFGIGLVALKFLPEIISAVGEENARRVHRVLPRKVTLLALWAAGRSPGCSLRGALTSLDTRDAQRALFAKIQSSSRRVEQSSGFELWATPYGEFWVPAGSSEGLIFTLAEQARDIYQQPGHCVEAGDVVLDCGAAFGVFTRTTLDRGAKLVVAIEPSPANVECLKRNFASEIAASRVIVYPKGLWNHVGVLRMYLHDNSVLDSFVMRERVESPTTGAIELPVTTIDRLVSELQLSRVDFI